jgi:hypothetical protein
MASMNRRRLIKTALFLLAGVLGLAACTPMSNRPYVERYPEYRGVNRVAVFLQRWPVNRTLRGQGEMQLEFITKNTPFLNALIPAERLPPRAVDVQDIDDRLMAAMLLEAFRNKGYDAFIAEMPSIRRETVAEVMARHRTLDPHVDAYLFCFYSPALFFSSAAKMPTDHRNRSFSLIEIIHALRPGEDRVIWAGSRAGSASPDSISHAFVYLSMTMFKADDRLVLWTMNDSQVAGRLRVMVWECPPDPVEEDYWADAVLIQRLMVNNVRCRLRRLIPDAFY